MSQTFSPMMSHDPNIGMHPSITNFPITLITLVGMILTSCFLMCYYVIVLKYCLNWNNIDLVRGRRFSISRRHEDQSSAENRGLEESVIQSIPVIQYKKEETDYERSLSFSECAVCLSEFQQDEKLRVIPNCSHVFHIDCVDIWLQNNANCPLCRTRVSLMTSQVHVDEVLTPRPSPQEHSQRFENLIGGDEDFVVIDLDNNEDEIDQNLQARQGKGKEVQRGAICFSNMKKTRKLHKVTSFGDECVGIRNKDDGFLVQPIRRSFSMELLVHREFDVGVNQSLHQRNVHGHEVGSFEGSDHLRLLHGMGAEPLDALQPTIICSN